MQANRRKTSLRLQMAALVAVGAALAALSIHRESSSLLVLTVLAMIILFAIRAELRERERLGQALADSERRLAIIDEASPAGFLLLDPKGQPVWASRRWRELSHSDPATYNGIEWLQAFHFDDLGRARTFWTSIRAHQKVATAQFRKATSLGDGWFELAIHPHFVDDQCLGFLVCLTDISDRKAVEAALLEIEERYRLVTENTRDMVFRIGLDGTALFVSSATRRVIGHEPGDLLGKPISGIVHRNDWPRFATNISDLLAGGGETELCLRLRCRTGEYLWVDASFQLVLTDTGEPIELIACVRETQSVGNIKKGSVAA